MCYAIGIFKRLLIHLKLILVLKLEIMVAPGEFNRTLMKWYKHFESAPTMVKEKVRECVRLSEPCLYKWLISLSIVCVHTRIQRMRNILTTENERSKVTAAGNAAVSSFSLLWQQTNCLIYLKCVLTVKQ